VLDVNGVKEYSASLTSNPPRLSIDLYGNSRAAAPMRAAKGKRGQEAVAEDSNVSAVAANGEARMVQNAAPKGMGTEEDFLRSSGQKIRRAPSVVRLAGARLAGVQLTIQGR